MLKTAIVAFLVGCATAIPTIVYQYERSYDVIAKDNNDYFSFVAGFNADLAYETKYQGPEARREMNPAESYSIRAFAEANGFVDLEFFQFYSHKINVKLNVFDFTPYGQTIWWSKPYGNNGQAGIGYRGWREMTGLEIKTEWIENAKVCESSFYDAIRDSEIKNNCFYDPENLSKAEDDTLSFAPLANLIGEQYGFFEWWSWSTLD